MVGPCAQAQGQGLTPAIRAVKEWRGRREFLAGNLAPQFVACPRWCVGVVTQVLRTLSLLRPLVTDLAVDHALVREC